MPYVNLLMALARGGVYTQIVNNSATNLRLRKDNFFSVRCRTISVSVSRSFVGP